MIGDQKIDENPKRQLTAKEYDIISQPLKNGWLVQGEFVRDFEDKFSEFTGVKNSIL